MMIEHATAQSARPLTTHEQARIVAEFGRRLTAQQRRALGGKRIRFDRDGQPSVIDAPRDATAALLALHARRLSWR